MTSRGLRVLSLITCLAGGLTARAEELKKPPPAPAASGTPAPAPASTAPAKGDATPAPAGGSQATVIEPREASAAPQAAPPPDVSALSEELSAVLDELIQARTRASVLAKSLFRTRLDIRVLRRADDQQVVRVKLALDGVPVHDSDGAAIASAEAHLFTGYVAPGVHEISIELSEQAKENPAYRYTRAERFRIETKRNTNTQVEVLLRDDSDMAEELPEGDEGTYEVSTRVRVKPVKVND